MRLSSGQMSIFFFNDTATTEIYTLSLHDALPIFLIIVTNNEWGISTPASTQHGDLRISDRGKAFGMKTRTINGNDRSEEHTSELQSRQYLVCRLLLEKKKQHISSEISTSLRHHLD